MIFGCANQAGKITATWRTWRRCWPVTRIPCRAPRLTACADRVWMPSALPPGDQSRRCRAADCRRRGIDVACAFRDGKASAPYQRQAELFDTTIGWRFVNPLMAQHFGTDSMPETAENVAELLNISRADQDASPGAASSARRRPSATAFWRRRLCRCRLSAGKGG
nr:Beta-ketoadipyl-CoA thiolase [Klebsiella pneumoniae]